MFSATQENKAYEALVYVTSESPAGDVTVALVTAKARASCFAQSSE